MSLDGNLPGFLLVKREPSPDGQQQTDLVSRHSRKVVYSAFVSPGPKYDCLFEDALFQSPLARCTAPNAQSKEKNLSLYNPDLEVEGGLKCVGKIGFTWRFDFQGETYEFRQPRLSSSKEFTLYLLRGSDPPVDLARFIIASPSSSSSSTAKHSEMALQQYNMDRFDLKDPKGLEVLIALGFLTFAHAYEERSGGGGKAAEGSRRLQAGGSGGGSKATSAGSPSLPPKTKDDGEDTLTGWQDYEDPPNPNEIRLSHPSIPLLANRAFDLLKDPSMVFVVLKAVTADEILRGTKVVEEVGRMRLRRWEEIREGEELHQYLVEEDTSPARPRPSPPTRGPPKPINLNDDPPSSLQRVQSTTSQPWDKTPPQAISFYLSKIVLADLQPKSKLAPPPPSVPPHRTSPPPPRVPRTTRPPPSSPRPSARPTTTTTSAGSASSSGSTAVFSPPLPPAQESSDGRMSRLVGGLKGLGFGK